MHETYYLGLLLVVSSGFVWVGGGAGIAIYGFGGLVIGTLIGVLGIILSALPETASINS
jgi:hypothetical protein